METVGQRIADLMRMRKWLRDNPDKVEHNQATAAICWLNGEIAALSANEYDRAG